MRRQPPSCGAFTLVELVAAMASASILVAGMASTMFVALRASNPATTPAAGMLTALTCMSDMSAELQFAVGGTEFTANAITVEVPDRSDANVLRETIRYAWSGVAGQPLTRRYNGGADVNVIPSVQSFTVSYYYNPSTALLEYITVRIQPTTSTRSVVETSISLLNL